MQFNIRSIVMYLPCLEILYPIEEKPRAPRDSLTSIPSSPKQVRNSRLLERRGSFAPHSLQPMQRVLGKPRFNGASVARGNFCEAARGRLAVSVCQIGERCTASAPVAPDFALKMHCSAASEPPSAMHFPHPLALGAALYWVLFCIMSQTAIAVGHTPVVRTPWTQAGCKRQMAACPQNSGCPAGLGQASRGAIWHPFP